jgi:Tol biopolymer transport system component
MTLVWALAILLVAVAIASIQWIRSREYFWHSPIADARFEAVTDFDGVAEAASLSRDGQLVAFLSDHDGPMDVWLTQLGSGQFHNLTHGSVKELVNPSVRTLGFTPDHAFVTFWARKPSATGPAEISIWAVPTLGGDPERYMEGVAEYDWSQDGSRVAYHTPGPGDPMFVAEGGMRSGIQPIFTAAPGLHSHFPLWSPDMNFLYFVQGALPDKLFCISSRARFPTNSTSGGLPPPAGKQSASPRKTVK